MFNSGTFNGSTFNGFAGLADFVPTLEDSEERQVGAWRIDGLNFDNTKVTLRLREKRSALDVEIPVAEFDLDTYPFADKDDTIGEAIPICFGTVRGARAFLIDASTSRFKLFNHSVRGMTLFYNQDSEGFTPTTIDLGDSEFTFDGWNGEDTLYADVVADSANPVDCIKLLLTDPVRGANLDLAELDTASSGKGFGVNGARLKYVVGLDFTTGAEATSIEIGLYVDSRRKVNDLIETVKAAAFGFVYVDAAGLWQYRAWEPEVGDGQLVITEDNIEGMLRPSATATEPITKAVAKYNEKHNFDEFSTATYEDTNLNRLRDLPISSIREKEVPISNRRGAELWTNRQVLIRGRARRMFNFRGTSELKLAEPGDNIRLNYAPLGIDESVLILDVTQKPGGLTVAIKATDNFGFRDFSGFWTADSPTFPAELGGATITTWDDTWTDAQKLWARENLGFWTDDNGYADSADDPVFSWGGSTWF